MFHEVSHKRQKNARNSHNMNMYENMTIKTVSVSGIKWSHSFIHLFSILFDEKSKASSKTMPPHSAI